jgi:hypothetical protein
LPVFRPSKRQLGRALGSCVAIALVATGSALAAAGGGKAGPLGAATSAAKPAIHTNKGCYVVGQHVRLIGKGFAPNRSYDVAIDGVDFGQGTTSAAGGFISPSLIPGGLAAGQVQHVAALNVTDGTSTAQGKFTVTRTPGTRLLKPTGTTAKTLSGPFQVWGFALGSTRKTVYLHYVSPAGSARQTVQLGRVAGQCGYLLTSSRRVFPFSPSTGDWVLQVDTHPAYASRPGGPVGRIFITVN